MNSTEYKSSFIKIIRSYKIFQFFKRIFLSNTKKNHQSKKSHNYHRQNYKNYKWNDVKAINSRKVVYMLTIVMNKRHQVIYYRFLRIFPFISFFRQIMGKIKEKLLVKKEEITKRETKKRTTRRRKKNINCILPFVVAIHCISGEAKRNKICAQYVFHGNKSLNSRKFVIFMELVEFS